MEVSIFYYILVHHLLELENFWFYKSIFLIRKDKLVFLVKLLLLKQKTLPFFFFYF